METVRLIDKIFDIFRFGDIKVNVDYYSLDDEGFYSAPIGYIWDLNKDFEIYNDKGIWVSNVYIKYSGGTRDIKIKINTPNRGEITGLLDNRSKTSNKNQERIKFEINTFVTSMRIYCENLLEDEIEIDGVKIEGFELEKMGGSLIEGCSMVESYANKKDKAISELKSDLDRIQYEIDNKKGQFEQLEESFTVKQELLDRLVDTESVVSKQIANLSKSLNHSEKQLRESADEREKLQRVNDILKKDIDKLKQSQTEAASVVNNIIEDIEISKSTLKKYKSDLSLYSEDFSMYKNNVFKNNVLYVSLIFIILLIGVSVVFSIYKSSAELIESYDSGIIKDVWGLLVSRLPTISMNILIVSFFLAMFHVLVNQIFDNNKKVSKVYQIAYLAKEVSESQSSDLSKIEEKEIFETRVRSKMTLIKDLLNENENEKIMIDNSNKNMDALIELIRSLKDKK